MLKVTTDNVLTTDNVNYGVLTHITESGNIATLTIAVGDREYPVLAERRITMNAITEMFGDEWEGQPVQFHVDSSEVLLWIASTENERPGAVG